MRLVSLITQHNQRTANSPLSFLDIELVIQKRKHAHLSARGRDYKSKIIEVFCKHENRFCLILHLKAEICTPMFGIHIVPQLSRLIKKWHLCLRCPSPSQKRTDRQNESKRNNAENVPTFFPPWCHHLHNRFNSLASANKAVGVFVYCFGINYRRLISHRMLWEQWRLCVYKC